MASEAKELIAGSAYTRSMDDAVQEVFGLMMGLACAGIDDPPSTSQKRSLPSSALLAR